MQTGIGSMTINILFSGNDTNVSNLSWCYDTLAEIPNNLSLQLFIDKFLNQPSHQEFTYACASHTRATEGRRTFPITCASRTSRPKVAEPKVGEIDKFLEANPYIRNKPGLA